MSIFPDLAMHVQLVARNKSSVHPFIQISTCLGSYKIKSYRIDLSERQIMHSFFRNRFHVQEQPCVCVCKWLVFFFKHLKETEI